MSDLCDLTCEACREGAPMVSQEEQSSLIEEIPGWSINTDPCDMLVKKFIFDDYETALAFTNAVAELAEAEGHHPKLILEWGLVYVSWWTHKINGLHKNDFICAAKTDLLYQS
jgi:4a-hydroxytetrahydrobiopterin dehydratase